ncbi:hypothetical protein LINPERHAP2_LOCUS14001 [Linum perenne]
MLNRDWMVKVEHIYREGNRVPYFLADLGHERSTSVHHISISDHLLSHRGCLI